MDFNRDDLKGLPFTFSTGIVRYSVLDHVYESVDSRHKTCFQMCDRINPWPVGREGSENIIKIVNHIMFCSLFLIQWLSFFPMCYLRCCLEVI